METLSLRSAPSHFIHDVADIHSHFKTRAVNQQLSYFRDLMDQRKRGVAISALVEGDDKPGNSQQAQRESLEHPVSRRNPTSSPFISGDRTPTFETRNIVPSRANNPSSLSSQKPLPSFSDLDYDSTKTSKLHEEILARHGHQERSRQLSPLATSTRPPLRDTSLGTQTAGPSNHLHSLASPSGRHQFLAGQPHYQSGPSNPTRQKDMPIMGSSGPLPSYTHGNTGSSRAISEQHFERLPSMQTSQSTQLPVSPRRGLETSRPLSEILEKTHAQIASQHRRNDSAVDRLQSNQSSSLPLQSQSLPLYHLRSESYNSVQLSRQPSTSSYTHLPALHQQSQSSYNYVQSPTSFHEHGHSVHSHHMPSSLAAATGNVHSSSVAARKRRGNLPREAVRLFKKWVEENKRYPYPNEAQKLDFERMTGLSMQQINNWFINARRRNLSERERAEMKRDKERQSPSGSPMSSRPESSHGLPDGDDFSLDGLSRQASHSRGHSGGGSLGY